MRSFRSFRAMQQIFPALVYHEVCHRDLKAPIKGEGAAACQCLGLQNNQTTL